MQWEGKFHSLLSPTRDTGLRSRTLQELGGTIGERLVLVATSPVSRLPEKFLPVPAGTVLRPAAKPNEESAQIHVKPLLYLKPNPSLRFSERQKGPRVPINSSDECFPHAGQT